MTPIALDKRLSQFVIHEYEALADPVNAVPMAAYMKTEMPFYGIPKPLRVPTYRRFKKEFAPANIAEYQDCISTLWGLSHREEKYAALEYAQMFDQYITSESLPLYERMVREGQWWDFVDTLAIALVGRVLYKERAKTKKVLDKWIRDDDMWIRRTAILAQNRHKAEADEQMLFGYCLKCAHEKEFFIRKAIGWALREYSYAAPMAVKRFVKENENVLSPLSVKEGVKQINRAKTK
ncbi:MAG TPA: DNA alkylation repair protein [Drouetiella sp.]